MTNFTVLSKIAPSIHRSITVKHGIKTYKDLLIHAWEMMTFDQKYKVKTRYIIDKEDLDFGNDEVKAQAFRYRASPVICVKGSLKKLKRDYLPDFNQIGFIDYGSGAGRVMFIAANMGFRDVYGVEMSEVLNEQCRRNIVSYNTINKSAKLTVIGQDAGTYLPDDQVGVFFFFKPFSNEVLQRVLLKIKESLERNPRKIFCMTLQADYYDFSLLGLTQIDQEFAVRIYTNRP